MNKIVLKPQNFAVLAEETMGVETSLRLIVEAIGNLQSPVETPREHLYMRALAQYKLLRAISEQVLTNAIKVGQIGGVLMNPTDADEVNAGGLVHVEESSDTGMDCEQSVQELTEKLVKHLGLIE